MSKYKRHFVNFFFKIVLPSFVAIALFISFLFLLLKPQFEEALMDKKREMIKELVNSAISILQKYHNDEKEGLLTREEAQKTAISRIQYLRYGEDKKDYFWITDMNPVMVMHPYVHDLIGKDLSDYSDPKGKKLFVECVEVVKKQKSGFVEYMWQFKDDSLHILPKISYVSLFEPWQWIVGTGVYIDDVKKEISQLTNRLIHISLIITGFIVFILMFIAFQSYKIEKKRQETEKELQISYEKYRSLVEASTEALVMIKDFKIVQANEWFTNLIQEDNITEESIHKYLSIPPHVAEQIEKGVLQIQPFEAVLNTQNKKQYNVLVNSSRVNIINDIYYVFTIRDISPLKHINKKIDATYEHIKELLDNIGNGYIRTTLDYKGKIIDANRTALKLLGYESVDNLKSTFIIDLYADSDDKRNIRKELLSTGFILSKKIRIKKLDGSIEYIVISLKIVHDDNGVPIYCEGLIKKAEEQILINRYSPTYNSTNLEINDFLLPIQKTGMYTSFESILNKLNECEYKFLLITDEKNEFIGYITPDEILSYLSQHQNYSESKAYQFMKSPVYSSSNETTISHILSLLLQSNNQLLLIVNSVGDKKVFYLPYFNKIMARNIEIRLNQLRECKTIEKLKSLKNELHNEIASRLATSGYSAHNLQLLSEIHDAVVHSVIQNAFSEYGHPPCSFAFIVMGSEARREQAFSTDQDNAIIIENNEHQEYFLKLGNYISYHLNELGYDFCKGNNMASNPKWTQPLTVWKKYFSEWIQNGNAQNLLDINIFFDMRTVYGNDALRRELMEHIVAESTNHKAFISLMAQNAIHTKVQAGSIIKIKDITSTLINIIRVYALNNSIIEASTLSRIQQLVDINVLSQATYADVYQSFIFLNSLKLKHQSIQYLQKLSPDNNIDSKSLSEFELYNLRYAISVIQSMQSKLTNDFKLY